MAISKKNAKQLAVSYAGFLRADNINSKLVWARMLDSYQEITGVVLMSGINLTISELERQIKSEAEKTNREINEWLDVIARVMGEHGASAESLNMLHACRPGHPLNKAATRPFCNLLFVGAGRAWYKALDRRYSQWLNRMASDEQRR